jgi:hypothetical protein
MRRASYCQAVEWIRTRLPNPIDPATIKQMELAMFVAFLFDVPADRVVADVAHGGRRDADPVATPDA